MNKRWKIKKEYLNESGCFARGGGVGVEDVQPGVDPELAQAPQLIQQMRAQAQQPQPAPFIPEAPTMPQMPNLEQPIPMSMPEQAQPQMPADPYMAEAQIQGKIAQDQTKAYDQLLATQVNLEKDVAARTKKFEDQRNEIVKYLDNTPVDANRYYNSHTDGGKVQLAIGLFLGGFGGGLTGTSNSALDFLNKQINNDIQSQLDSRKSKETLLGQLERQYGNQTQAMQVLQSTLQTRLANQINRAALASGDKLALARAQQVTAQLMQQANPPLQAMAQERALGDILAAGQDPLAMGIQMDEKQAKRAVPGYGLANDPEIAKKLKDEHLPSYDNAKTLIKQLKALTVADKVNPVVKSQAAAIYNRLAGASRLAVVGPGAMTEADWKILEKSIPNPADIFTLGAQSKLENFEKDLDSAMQGRLKTAGLKVPEAKQEKAPEQIRFKRK